MTERFHEVINDRSDHFDGYETIPIPLFEPGSTLREKQILLLFSQRLADAADIPAHNFYGCAGAECIKQHSVHQERYTKLTLKVG